MSYAYCRECDHSMNAPTLGDVRFNLWECKGCGLTHLLDDNDRIERLAVFIDELTDRIVALESRTV